MDKNLSQLNNLLKDELSPSPPKKKKWLWLIFVVLLTGFLWAGTIIFKKERSFLLSNQSIPSKPAAFLKNEPAENFPIENLNILILGIPGQGNDAPNLTDSILLASIKDNSVNLISIPRDFLVKIPNQNNFTKINALYSFNGADAIKTKIEEISGLTINHHIIVNLQVIKELIDKTGGLNVLVQKDIYDTRYPGPNHSFQTFEIKQGWRYLDGETALKYIRSRYSTSDFDRMERQQQIVDALKKKLSSLKIWNLKEISDIYSSLSSHIKTDLNAWEIWQLWKTINPPAVNGRTNSQISKYAIDEKFLISDTISLDGQESYILKPKAGLENYREIRDFIQKIQIPDKKIQKLLSTP